ncbi:hypothetical protein F5B22DRAFT_333170 [Xylaria bambusicola]|uniref:uncharacterized protein n=1 Tax=Xylaria bambusicola TaxID=326684 RepID=UPI0020086696|nr:uncharacterized protein F5B22DRAFT_333170 [Xylaria bambusicola]KAI0525310.1 hypothetical protein F5B22DRAFT_333170 [Xylaria bambusicola]
MLQVSLSSSSQPFFQILVAYTHTYINTESASCNPFSKAVVNPPVSRTHPYDNPCVIDIVQSRDKKNL